MAITPESLYQQAGALIHSMPKLDIPGPPPPGHLAWLGKLAALLQEAGETADLLQFKHYQQNYMVAVTRANLGAQIQSIAYRLLAVAELRAPAAAQGTFIAAGNAFDGLAAVGKLLQSAANDALIIDPYMDDKALTTFAVLAPESVNIRLLADTANVKPSLKPAVGAWTSQYGARRPIVAKLAAARSLHDRLIIIDGRDAYSLGQSLNAFATRAPTSILKADPETAALKVTAYASIWAAAGAL